MQNSEENYISRVRKVLEFIKDDKLSLLSDLELGVLIDCMLINKGGANDKLQMSVKGKKLKKMFQNDPTYIDDLEKISNPQKYPNLSYDKFLKLIISYTIQLSRFS